MMSSFDEETIYNIRNSMIRMHNKCNITKRLYELFTKHPHSNGMTYGGHWLRAIKLSLKMGYGSFCLLIHSIFPFLCETTGTNVVRELYDYVINHRLNEEENNKSE